MKCFSVSHPLHMKKVWVVFTGQTDISWLRVLKCGFRHCFILMKEGERWISIDPLSSYTDIQIYSHLEDGFDLPKSLEKQGYRVSEVFVNRSHKKAAPWALLTCVESVKRILGLHKRFVITPWQLYCHLEKLKIIQTQSKEISHG